MREKLLDTAIDHFGRLGFEGAATRAIAADAETAMSQITYHFGGKEGLYLACADYIASNISGRIVPQIETLGEIDRLDAEAAAEAICMLIGVFARMMLDPATKAYARIIAREQQSPTDAFDRLYHGAMEPIVETAIALVRRARPEFSEREVRATGILIWGQAITLRTCRASVSRVMQVDDIDAETAELLVAQLIANTRCLITQLPEKKR